ncbi:hypothetical protein FISHEDRAFT_62416 [Fistulina hepatica ATCC 64428]|nr:hypothetical protein FISHEDRAFT_62416 [Fistulina hepatica ATCC 64428]
MCWTSSLSRLTALDSPNKHKLGIGARKKAIGNFVERNLQITLIDGFCCEIIGGNTSSVDPQRLPHVLAPSPVRTPSYWLIWKQALGDAILADLRTPPDPLLNSLSDPSDVGKPGVEVNELLDCVMISTMVVYTPLYACASFLTRQVMTAWMWKDGLARPAPAAFGFAVNTDAASLTMFDTWPPQLHSQEVARRLEISDVCCREEPRPSNSPVVSVSDNEYDSDDADVLIDVVAMMSIVSSYDAPRDNAVDNLTATRLDDYFDIPLTGAVGICFPDMLDASFSTVANSSFSSSVDDSPFDSVDASYFTALGVDLASVSTGDSLGDDAWCVLRKDNSVLSLGDVFSIGGHPFDGKLRTLCDSNASLSWQEHLA